VQGAAFRGTKIWNCEIWLLLANWRLQHALNTPSFGTTPLWP